MCGPRIFFKKLKHCKITYISFFFVCVFISSPEMPEGGGGGRGGGGGGAARLTAFCLALLRKSSLLFIFCIKMTSLFSFKFLDGFTKL